MSRFEKNKKIMKSIRWSIIRSSAPIIGHGMIINIPNGVWKSLTCQSPVVFRIVYRAPGMDPETLWKEKIPKRKQNKKLFSLDSITPPFFSRKGGGGETWLPSNGGRKNNNKSLEKKRFNFSPRPAGRLHNRQQFSGSDLVYSHPPSRFLTLSHSLHSLTLIPVKNNLFSNSFDFLT
jgi:hypothetical protein